MESGSAVQTQRLLYLSVEENDFREEMVSSLAENLLTG